MEGDGLLLARDIARGRVSPALKSMASEASIAVAGVGMADVDLLNDEAFTGWDRLFRNGLDKSLGPVDRDQMPQWVVRKRAERRAIQQFIQIFHRCTPIRRLEPLLLRFEHQPAAGMHQKRQKLARQVLAGPRVAAIVQAGDLAIDGNSFGQRE